MKTTHLESLLRTKVSHPTPRPGFKTRIQALAREPVQPPKRSLSWLSIPAFAALVIGLLISQSPSDPSPTVAQVVSEPRRAAKEDPPAFIEDTPVHRELQAVKSDAAKTLDFLSRSLPSLTLTKKAQ